MKLTVEWGYHLNTRGEAKCIVVDEVVTLDQLQGALDVVGDFLAFSGELFRHRPVAMPPIDEAADL